jgi:cellulose synthase/poly-beta-1,6-N-acetylglucosamine synthase-like glycosyltransferase
MHQIIFALFLLSAIFFFFMVYVSLMTLLYSESTSSQGHDLSASGISIVIPFRNEAPRLSGLLESLMKQEYPGPYEIILVDDGSSDDFSKPIDPFLRLPHRPVRLVRSDFDSRKKLTSKQQALDAGVAAARYPYLAFTDADMAFGSGWLVSLARMIPLGYDLVFGHTVIRKSAGSFLEHLQAFQLEFLFAVAYAFHASRLPGSCMGNNLLLSKKAYTGIGGQTGVGYSVVEDRALYSTLKRRGFKVAPAFPFIARAETYPCKDLRGFSRQMVRWSRGGLFEQHDLLPIAALFCAHYGFLILALFGGAHGSLSWVAFADFGILFFFTLCAFGKIDSKERGILFPVYYAFLLLETIAFLFSLIASPSISWKNRKL